eukprot:3682185-Pyramimonas_sp.AAC.1
MGLLTPSAGRPQTPAPRCAREVDIARGWAQSPGSLLEPAPLVRPRGKQRAGQARLDESTWRWCDTSSW